MNSAAKPAFAAVVLDVDSTLCGIEGIDWLAARRGPAVAVNVAAATDRAMRGEIPLEAVYAERLAAVRPSRDDVAALATAYSEALATGAAEAVARWVKSGIRVELVSSGIRNSILPVAAAIGLTEHAVHAVEIRFDPAGGYDDFDRSSPLTTAVGKRDIVSSLALPRPTIAVGDGSTDLALRPAVDVFAAFTGFVSRPSVTEEADYTVASFDELSELLFRCS